MNKKGRPSLMGSKKKTANQIRVYLSEEDWYKLGYVAGKKNLTKSEVLRKGLNSMYNLAKMTDYDDEF